MSVYTDNQLYTLVSNLQNSVNSIQSSFSNIQSAIGLLNITDSSFNVIINNTNIKDGNQDSLISTLMNEDTSIEQQINAINALFPITNSSIIDESISVSKITNLNANLLNINNEFSILQNNIALLLQKETTDTNNLSNNLTTVNNLVVNNNNSQNAKWALLLGSITGTTSNPFQIAIDRLSNSLSTLETTLNSALSNITQLQSSNTVNQTSISTLQNDNSINKNNITTNRNNITSNTSAINNVQSQANAQALLISNLTAKEQQDINNLTSIINSLNTSVGTTNSSLLNQITQLQTKENNDVADLQQQITNNLNQEISDVQTLTTNLQNQINKENADVLSLTSLISALTTKENNDTNSLQSQITTNLNQANTRFSNNETSITNNATNIATNTTNIATNTTNIATNTSNIATNTTQITQNTSDINILYNGQSTHQSNISSINSTLMSLHAYDVQNTNNLNQIHVELTDDTNKINTVINTTIPNLANIYLIKNGDTMSGPLTVNEIDCSGTLIIGQTSNVINIGTSVDQSNKIINIGGAGDTVNILGATNYIETTDTKIQNKTIVLNAGSVGNNQSGQTGFLIRDDDVDNKGYIKTNSDSTKLLIKPPQNNNIFAITDTPSNPYDIVTKLYSDTQNAVMLQSMTALTTTTTNLSNQVTTINNNQLSNIPFSRLNAFPSDNTQLLYGDGTFGKLDNNAINNNSIDGKKLIGATNPNYVLYGDGIFKIPNLTLNTLMYKLGQFDNDMTNKRIMNVASAIDDDDCVNLLQVTSLLNNAVSTITTSIFNVPTLNQMTIKSVTNNIITFIDASDTLVNCNSVQVLNNKTIEHSTLGTYLTNQNNNNINVPSNNNSTLVIPASITTNKFISCIDAFGVQQINDITVGYIANNDQVILNNDTLPIFAGKTQGQLNNKVSLNKNNEFVVMNNKSLLSDLDLLIAEDSSNSYSKIKLTLATLVTYLNTKITSSSSGSALSLFDSQWFYVLPNTEYTFSPNNYTFSLDNPPQIRLLYSTVNNPVVGTNHIYDISNLGSNWNFQVGWNIKWTSSSSFTLNTSTFVAQNVNNLINYSNGYFRIYLY